MTFLLAAYLLFQDRCTYCLKICFYRCWNLEKLTNWLTLNGSMLDFTINVIKHVIAFLLLLPSNVLWIWKLFLSVVLCNRHVQTSSSSWDPYLLSPVSRWCWTDYSTSWLVRPFLQPQPNIWTYVLLLSIHRN